MPDVAGTANSALSRATVADVPTGWRADCAGSSGPLLKSAPGDGRRCLACGGWVAGAGRCPACGDVADVPDDVGRAAVQAGAKHVYALDRASRGRGVRGFLSADDMRLKTILIALALLGVAVAVSGVAGFVFVAAVALLAVVPASIADDRGGHRPAWYLYGVLLFPVAVAHALMLPPSGNQPAAGSGDRQLRALMGGAAALFITICLGLITIELAASASSADDTDACYELSDQARDASGTSDAASLYDAAADCLEQR